MLQPGDAHSLVTLQFTAQSPREFNSQFFTTELELSTNLSNLRIPLLVHHGLLNCGLGAPFPTPVLDRGQLESVVVTGNCSRQFTVDLGKLVASDVRSQVLVLENPNPENVTIETVFYSDSRLSVTLERLFAADGEEVEGEEAERRILPGSEQPDTVRVVFVRWIGFCGFRKWFWPGVGGWHGCVWLFWSGDRALVVGSPRGRKGRSLTILRSASSFTIYLSD